MHDGEKAKRDSDNVKNACVYEQFMPPCHRNFCILIGLLALFM